MDILNEKYNQKELLKQEKNHSATNHQHLIQIIDIISEICKKDEIEELNKFIIGNDDQEGFFKKLYSMLTLENSELNQRYNEISWELIQSLVESLNQSSIDWDINNHNLINSTSKNILSIIEWISNNSSAREFLLIIQEFDGSSFINQTLFTKISMIIFIQNALKRIPTEKRFNFLKSILPPLLKILIDEKKDENNNGQDTMINNNNEELINNNMDQDEEEEGDEDDDEEDDESNPKEPIKIIGPDIEQELQQKNTDNDIKWQYPLSCIMDFIYSFALDLKAQDTRNDDPNSGITTPRAINSRDPTKESKPNTPIAQQQHLFLNFIIKILSLESVLNPPQSLLCNGMPLLNVVNECFSLIGASTSYILGTDQRYRLKKREIELEEMYFDQGLNEEDFQDDQDLNLNDPNRKSKKEQVLESSVDMDSDDSYIDSDDDQTKSDNEEEDTIQNHEEEQDEYSSIDKLFDLDLQYSGIGHLLYLLVLKPTEISRLPSPQSPYSLLMDNLPYLINLLQHKSYRIGFKTIQIISFLQKRLKLACIDIGGEFLKNPVVEDTIQELMIKATEQHGGNLKSAIERSKNQSETRTRWIHDQSTNSIERPYHFLQLIECMISFLVRCPVQQMRSFSYKVLMLLISNQLKASTKFNLLSTLISTCIFPSFTGLLIHIFKEEINKCWNSSEDASVDHLKSYFRSPKILEIVTIPMQTGGNLLERMDSIMNGLNLYRYLLIRDTNTNYTGVWSKSKIQGSKESCLFPLRKDLLDVQSQFRASSQGDEKAMAQVLQGVSKMGVENLSKDEIKNASTLVCFHIDMALDVIARILELQDTLSLNQNSDN